MNFDSGNILQFNSFFRVAFPKSKDASVVGGFALVHTVYLFGLYVLNMCPRLLKRVMGTFVQMKLKAREQALPTL